MMTCFIRWSDELFKQISHEIPSTGHCPNIELWVVSEWACNQERFLRQQKHTNIPMYFHRVLYSLLGVQSVAKVVRHGRLRWFGHVECKNGDDWVSACRNVVVAGVRSVGRDRKTWRECVKEDTDELGLHPEWAVWDVWRGLISGQSWQTSNPSWAWKKWTF